VSSNQFEHPFTPRRDSEITCFTCGRDESDHAHAPKSPAHIVRTMMTTGDYSADWWRGYEFAKAQAVRALSSAPGEREGR
jgi:hypothetical protein